MIKRWVLLVISLILLACGNDHKISFVQEGITKEKKESDTLYCFSMAQEAYVRINSVDRGFDNIYKSIEANKTSSNIMRTCMKIKGYREVEVRK